MSRESNPNQTRWNVARWAAVLAFLALYIYRDFNAALVPVVILCFMPLKSVAAFRDGLREPSR